MFCIHHVTLGFMFEYQCKLKIFWLMCHQKFHLGICRHMQQSNYLQIFFRHCAYETCVKICLPVTLHMRQRSTHAANVSARLQRVDFTVCSMIHNWQHQVHERHGQQLPNSWNLYISIHAFQLHTTLCSPACEWLSDMWTEPHYDVRTGCLDYGDRRLTCIVFLRYCINQGWRTYFLSRATLSVTAE